MKQVKIEKLEDDWSEFLEEDENVYSEQFRESLLEDDELSVGEAGFMEGYEEAE